MTCPADITRQVTARNAVIFGAACPTCPLREKVHHRQSQPHPAPAVSATPMASANAAKVMAKICDRDQRPVSLMPRLRLACFMVPRQPPGTSGAG